MMAPVRVETMKLKPRQWTGHKLFNLHLLSMDYSPYMQCFLCEFTLHRQSSEAEAGFVACLDCDALVCRDCLRQEIVGSVARCPLCTFGSRSKSPLPSRLAILR